jgi:hypothetical protein
MARRSSMKVFLTKKLRLIATLAAISLAVTAARAQTAAARILSAANSFLSTLDAKQRRSVLYAFDDEQQRHAGQTSRRALCPVVASA